MPTRRKFLLTTPLIAGLAAQTHATEKASGFTFAAMGDMPYSKEEFPLLRTQLAELEPTMPFIFHVGDIKRSTVPFREDAYSLVADDLKRSKVPVFITLGDNEYNDAADPELALSYWKKYLGDMHNNWKHGQDVQYQPARRENISFVHQGALFIMINLVGSKIHNKKEWDTRLKDDADWLTTCFEASGEKVRAAVIIGHSHPKDTRQSVGRRMTSLAKTFGKPVLYIHGDGHKWIEDNPFPEAPNIKRVQVDQGAIAPPVRVTLAEEGMKGEMFTFDRRITEEYKLRKEKYLKKPKTEKQ